MSKRFTETNKWSDPWFRTLSIREKALWGWMCDNCDIAGVLNEIDWALLSFQIGDTFTEKDLEKFKLRVEPCGKGFWIKSFVAFQAGYIASNTKSAPHRGILKALNRSGITLEKAMDGVAKPLQPISEGLANPSESLSLPLEKAIHSLKDKDKNKDKEQDKDKDLVLVAPDQPEIPLAKQTPTQADAIWALYPKKSGKKEAFPEINAAIKAHGFEKIREAVAAYAAAVATWQTADHVYIPDPVRWFKRGKYDDDRSTWQRGTVAPTYREPKLRIE